MDYDLARPWARQPCDTDLGWRLFQDYLQLQPPRALGDIALKPGAPPRAVLDEIAWEGLWVDRARAWDRHLDRCREDVVVEVTREDARQRAERQGLGGRKLARLAEREIDRLLARQAQAGQFDIGISLKDAIRALHVGTSVERLAYGDSTERVEVSTDFSKLSVEDLRALRELQEKTGPGY